MKELQQTFKYVNRKLGRFYNYERGVPDKESQTASIDILLVTENSGKMCSSFPPVTYISFQRYHILYHETEPVEISH